MKRLMIALIVSAVLLTGCETSEVQKRLVVHAIGIDRGDSGYEVSYQIFSGGTTNDGPIDASESNVVTLLAQGRTLSEAEESLRLQTGREIFLGDTELIVISEDIKDSDLQEFLQYFRKADVYLGVNVVYCRGKASETIGQKLNQGSAPAILLREVVEEAIEGSRACSSRIIEISNALFEEGEAIAIPILKIERNNDSDEELTISDLTIGVFDSLPVWERGFGEELDENAVMGIRLMRGDAKKMALSVRTPNGVATVRLSGISVKKSVGVQDGAPLVELDISGQYTVTSSSPGTSDSEIADAIEKQLLSLCVDAYEGVRDHGGDFFNLIRMLWRYEPEYIEKVGTYNAIKTAKYSITAHIQKY